MLCLTDGSALKPTRSRYGAAVLTCDYHSEAWERGCFHGCGRRLLLALCIWLALIGGLQAHDLFAEYVHHRVKLSARENHLDLTFELTFFEEGSEQERRIMDCDGSGRIERGEVDAYVKRLSRGLTNAPTVFVGDEQLRVSPLYEPEVNLLGNDAVQWAHHRLVLFYFVPVLPRLTDGAVLRVGDPFWPSWPAVVVVQGAASEGSGLGLRPEVLPDSLLRGVREGERREFRVIVESKVQRPLAEIRPSAGEEETYAD
jgi:hypothetical protein